MNFRNRKIKGQVGLLLVLTFFSLSLGLGNIGWTKESQLEEKDLGSVTTATSSTASGEEMNIEQPKKGGIFKVGRAFKKVGGGIKKGMVATGRAFKKAGTVVKSAFTGKSSEPETRPSSVDTGLDHVGDENGPPKSGNGAS